MAEEDHSTLFKRTGRGLIRHPSSVEQVSVEHESTRNWLVVRSNGLLLRFPLTDKDCLYLASLLTSKLPIPRAAD